MNQSSAGYELLERIGSGTESTVYRARDFSLRRFVAVKELHEKLRQDRRRLSQFIEEAQFLAGLEHDNIVDVYGVVPEQGWVVMELMRGSLEQKAAEGPLDAGLVRSVLRQVLDALKFLHAQDRVHGQISPGNILINDHGRVKLSVFGATTLGSEFRPPRNPKYLAPELLDEHSFGKVSPAVDLYCLGFVAIELLKGPGFEGLFKGVSIDPQVAWIRWHRSATEVLPPCRELIPGVPADVANVVDRLLRKRVAERYGSAEEVLEALEKTAVLPVEMPEHSPPVPGGSREAEVRDVHTPRAERPQLPPADPAVAAPASAGRASSTPRPARTSQQPLKDRLNAIFEDRPALVYGVIGSIVLLTILSLFLPQGSASRRVVFDIEPSTAVVTVGNVVVKDADELDLDVGSHAIRAQLDGYKTYDEPHDIESGKTPLTVSIVLERAFAGNTGPSSSRQSAPAPQQQLFLQLEPWNATVKSDNDSHKSGDEKGLVTVPVDALITENSLLRLRIEAAGYATRELSFGPDQITGSQANPLPVKLNPYLVIVPESATVQIDGKPAPLAEGRVELDARQSAFPIEATADGFSPFRKTLGLEELADAGFKIELQELPEIQIFLAVEPPTATVILNERRHAAGSERGEVTVPVSAAMDENSQLALRVEADGYAPRDLSFGVEQIQASRESPVRVRLNPYLYFVPDSTVVVIGGKPAELEDGRLELDAGQAEYPVEAHADGFARFRKTLGIEELTSLGFRIELRKLTGIESLGLVRLENGNYVASRLAAADQPLEFALIEPGEFSFGVADDQRLSGELQAENRHLESPFLISVTEVANSHYHLFADDVGEDTAGSAWRADGNDNAERAAYPVTNVAYQQAAEFCKWLGGRLPSELEWEGAAKRKEGDLYLKKYANLGPSAKPMEVRTIPGGAAASGESLLHMLGNVAEWCEEVYSAGEGEGPDDPGVGTFHAIRGGSYLDPATRARITMRSNCPPEGAHYVGIRVVIPLPPGTIKTE